MKHVQHNQSIVKHGLFKQPESQMYKEAQLNNAFYFRYKMYMTIWQKEKAVILKPTIFTKSPLYKSILYKFQLELAIPVTSVQSYNSHTTLAV